MQITAFSGSLAGFRFTVRCSCSQIFDWLSSTNVSLPLQRNWNCRFLAGNEINSITGRYFVDKYWRKKTAWTPLFAQLGNLEPPLVRKYIWTERIVRAIRSENYSSPCQKMRKEHWLEGRIPFKDLLHLSNAGSWNVENCKEKNNDKRIIQKQWHVQWSSTTTSTS